MAARGIWWSGLLVFSALLWAGEGKAQEERMPYPATNVVIPQARSFAAGSRGRVDITGVKVGVVILEQVATTTMEIALNNPHRFRLEAELVVPVPEDAVVKGFTFQGAASEPTAQVLPREEAHRTYDAIVAKVRDPALLEFIGYNLIRSSVFPVEAQGMQKVRLTYEHILPTDGERIDYLLPRSESLEYTVPWEISVKIKSGKPISTVYSPSHRLETRRQKGNEISAWTLPETATAPGPFRLSYLLEGNGVTASLLAYPAPQLGGGYFLLLAGLPAKLSPSAGESAIKRELILVLDRSGSMRGEKLEQVREAAVQILAGLEQGETFNIIVYNDTVDFFSGAPVPKTEATVKAAMEYLQRINAGGGTNIHDALSEALRQKPGEGMLPLALFLTDGQPTVGQTSEVAIREVAIKANPHERRLFTFGVGVDVNTPLLDRLASETRATATYVLPRESVEVKVAQVFKQLAGPVLASPALEIIDSAGKPAPERVRELLPSKLPDFFEGDQLVLLGQYTGGEPVTFKLSGNYLGRKRAFRFTFPLDKATTKNAFVPRLWASRKIGALVDAIRQRGANAGPVAALKGDSRDPALKELMEEVVRLSTEFGILTEYTAFLAREGTNLARRDEVLREAGDNFLRRAINVRSGLGGVNQSLNLGYQINQQELRADNWYFDENMNRVAVTAVQQINDLAFYRRGGRWVDSRIVERESKIEPKRVIEFGSEEFRKLARKLAGENRQGSIALSGDILIIVDGEPVLVKGPTAATAREQ